MQINTVNTRHQAISAIERTLADEEIDDILGPADNLLIGSPASLLRLDTRFPVCLLDLRSSMLERSASCSIPLENTEAGIFEVIGARGRRYLGLREKNLVLVNLGLYGRTGLVVDLS